MPPAIELVVTDLDGTLWEQQTTIPEQTLAAWSTLEARGVPILVATGRRVQSTLVPLAVFGLAPPAVVLNGALGLELASGSRFHRGGFGVDDALAVLDVFTTHDVSPCVYIDGDAPSVYVSDAPSSHRDHLSSFGDDVGTARLDDVVSAQDVLAFSVLGADEHLADRLARDLARVATPHTARDREYGGFGITVAPRAASKWDGIRAYCRAAGIDERAVLAVGDGPNDAEMLEMAAVAVVPEDAHPAARMHADHVIGRAIDGGWAEIVDLH